MRTARRRRLGGRWRGSAGVVAVRRRRGGAPAGLRLALAEKLREEAERWDHRFDEEGGYQDEGVRQECRAIAAGRRAVADALDRGEPVVVYAWEVGLPTGAGRSGSSPTAR